MGEDLKVDGGALARAGAGMVQAAAGFNASERSLAACGSAAVSGAGESSEQEATMTIFYLGDQAHQAGTSLTVMGGVFEAMDSVLGGLVGD